MQLLLQQKLSLFLANPSRRNCNIGLIFSLLFVITTFIWFLVGDFTDNKFYFLFAFVLLLAYSLFIYRISNNILFLFRFSLLLIIPLGASASRSFFEDVLIAPFGAVYQTHSATVALIASGMFSLAGSSCGWFAVFRNFNTSRNINYFQPILSNLRLARYLTLILAYISTSLIIYAAAGFASAEKAYATVSNSFGFQFDALNCILFLSTALFIIASSILNQKYITVFYLLAPCYILPLLTGARADFLMQLFVIVSPLLLKYSEFNSFFKRKRFLLLGLTSGVFLFYLANIIAVYRAGNSLFNAIDFVFTNNIFLTIRESGTMLSIETANQMSAHFYVVYSKLQLLGEDLLYGKTYLDFIPRSIPAFFGTTRPEDLAWSMYIVKNKVMSQGGIYEVAEAYWNLGLIGSFVFPCAITFGLGVILRIGLSYSKNWIYCFSSFIALGLMAPRAVWYQSFAYWRLLTVFLVGFYILKFLNFKLCSSSLPSYSNNLKMNE